MNVAWVERFGVSVESLPVEAILRIGVIPECVICGGPAVDAAGMEIFFWVVNASGCGGKPNRCSDCGLAFCASHRATHLCMPKTPQERRQ